MIDKEIKDIARDNLLSTVGKRVIMIVEDGPDFVVHRHTEDGVSPQSRYLSKRLAAARVLQLLGIGPVAPQTHPESAEIDNIMCDVVKGEEE